MKNKLLLAVSLLALISLSSAQATPVVTGGMDLTYHNGSGLSNQEGVAHVGVKWNKGPYHLTGEVGYKKSLAHNDMPVLKTTIARGPAKLDLAGGKDGSHKFLSGEARYKRVAVYGSKETGNVLFPVVGAVNTKVTSLGVKAYVFTNTHVDVSVGATKWKAENKFGTKTATVPSVGLSIKF